MANRTTYTKARAELASLCDTVAETREPYVIERRNGENVANVVESITDIVGRKGRCRVEFDAQQIAW